MPAKKKQKQKSKKKPAAKKKAKSASKKLEQEEQLPPSNAEIMKEGFKVLGQGMKMGIDQARKGMRALRSKAGWGRKEGDQ